MSSRRALKAAEAIREVVGMAILTDLRDPRVEHVTVTRVEVSPDLRNARVFVSVMGSETKQKLAMKGLESSAGFLQSKIATRIDTRYTPRLQFKVDDGVKKSIAIAQMLAEVLPDETAPDEEPKKATAGELGAAPADGSQDADSVAEKASEASPVADGD